MWDVIIHHVPNFNDNLTKLPLTDQHGENKSQSLIIFNNDVIMYSWPYPDVGLTNLC